MATRLQSTTRLLRWLTPGLEIKRWLLLLMFAELVLVLGFAYGLKALYTTAELPHQFYYITLQFLPYWLRAAIFGTLGIGPRPLPSRQQLQQHGPDNPRLPAEEPGPSHRRHRRRHRPQLAAARPEDVHLQPVG